MGLWEDVSGAVSDAVDTVADVAQAVVEGVADATTDVVETVGNAAEDVLNVVGNTFPLLEVATSWLGGVIAGITNVLGAVIKASGAIFAGVLGGLIRIIGGILCLDLDLILKGLIDIVSGIGGAVLIILGTLVSLVQRILPFQNFERSLTKEERGLLTAVFFNSISLYDIRLIEGRSGVFDFNNLPFTLANTIYMKDTNPSVRPEILVHECVHVWQYQNLGSRYATDALGAQAIYGGGVYDWEAELARGTSDWNDFNKEAQAKLMQDIWTFGSLTSNGYTRTGEGAFYGFESVQSDFVNGSAEFVFNGTNYTDLAMESIRSLRGRINARFSRAY